MVYVDGYIGVIKKGKLAEYKKAARTAGKFWIKHGALEYMENVGDDLKSVEKWGGIAYPKVLKLKPGEKVFYSFILYRSKKQRDHVNKKVHEEFMKDQDKWKNKPTPFDMKRMGFGGFTSVVHLKK